MDFRVLVLYFVIGGVVVSLVTHLGSQGKGILAAFIMLFPTVTLLTFCMIYFGSGAEAVTLYSKSLLTLTPAWLIYILCLTLLTSRFGFPVSLGIGVSFYVVISFLTMRFL